MQICISMLQCSRSGPWEPGNEAKYTARLAREIEVIMRVRVRLYLNACV